MGWPGSAFVVNGVVPALSADLRLDGWTVCTQPAQVRSGRRRRRIESVWKPPGGLTQCNWERSTTVSWASRDDLNSGRLDVDDDGDNQVNEWQDEWRETFEESLDDDDHIHRNNHNNRSQSNDRRERPSGRYPSGGGDKSNNTRGDGRLGSKGGRLSINMRRKKNRLWQSSNHPPSSIGKHPKSNKNDDSNDSSRNSSNGQSSMGSSAGLPGSGLSSGSTSSGSSSHGGNDERSEHGRSNSQNLGAMERKRIKEKFFSLLRTRSRDAFRFVHESEWEPDIGDLNDILSRLSKQKLIGAALEVIREAEISWRLIPPKKMKTAILVIDIFGKAKMLDKAIRTFDFIESVEGGKMNAVAFNALVAACARSNRSDLSFAVIDKMRERGLEPDKFTFGSIIDALGKSGDVEKAFEVADRMESEGIRMDQASYSALIDACGRSGRLDWALLVYEDMKNRGVWPNVITFAVLVEACAESDEPELAFRIFREMRQWSIKPNVVIYTSLIDTCCKAKRMDKAEEVLTDMRANGVAPNTVTFGCIIHGYCSLGDLDSAFDMLQSMVEDKCIPSSKLLLSLLHFCRINNRPDLAPLIWMVHVNFQQYMSPSFYLKMITMASQIGDVEMGLEIARGSARDVSNTGLGLRASFSRAFSSLLRAARSTGDNQSAKAIIGLMRDMELGR